MDQYVVWNKGTFHDEFYSKETIKQWFRDYISFLLQRKNSKTGIVYKDDPTIFAWELTNELRCAGTQRKNSGTCTSSTLVNWVSEMAAYVKRIDPNHMVSVGDEGFFKRSSTHWTYDGSHGDFDAYLSDRNIDFGTLHLYPEDWGYLGSQWGSTYLSEHKNALKPVILEEYGWEDQSSRYSVYSTWTGIIETQDFAGDLIWMISSNQDGGSKYPDYDGYTIYNDGSSVSVLLKSHIENMRKKSTKGITAYIDQESSITSNGHREIFGFGMMVMMVILYIVF